VFAQIGDDGGILFGGAIALLLTKVILRPGEPLVVSTATNAFVIPVAEIDWISADDYYTCLHVGAKDHLLRESLTSLEARLDARRFARGHRAAIVQLDRIRELRATVQGDEVVLRNGSRVPVSRGKRAMLEDLLRYRIARPT
jgi:two-component system LytT family response regulator